MYISNPNRKRRADSVQANSNISRATPPNASSNRPQTTPQQMQQPQTPQFRAPQMRQPPQPQREQYEQPQVGDTQPQYEQPQENTGVGGLIVRVTTASGAIPIENALVTIREYRTGSGGDIVATLTTNSSGLTEKISLPTPPRSMSLSPGNGKSYSSFVIQVDKDGYNTQQYINVPIFDGVTAVQTADLVPLPENGETDRADPYNPGIFYESASPKLEQSNPNN